MRGDILAAIGERRSRGARAAGVCAALVVAPLAGGADAAEPRGRYAYGSLGACLAAHVLPAPWCENAAANARAAFIEKAPTHPSREACERAHGRGRCAVAFERGGVVFTMRQEGFVVVARSGREASVTPAPESLGARPRSVLTRDAAIDPRARRAAAPAGGGRADPGPVFGVATPQGERGPAPPPVPVDPNFDCSALLEPDARGGASPGCYPARRPAR